MTKLPIIFNIQKKCTVHGTLLTAGYFLKMSYTLNAHCFLVETRALFVLKKGIQLLNKLGGNVPLLSTVSAHRL